MRTPTLPQLPDKVPRITGNHTNTMDAGCCL
jgi:hypothetical protein